MLAEPPLNYREDPRAVRSHAKLYDPYKCWESLCGGRYAVMRNEIRKDEQRYDQLNRHLNSATDTMDHVRRYDDMQCRALHKEDFLSRMALTKTHQARVDFHESDRIRCEVHGPDRVLSPLDASYYAWRVQEYRAGELGNFEPLQAERWQEQQAESKAAMEREAAEQRAREQAAAREAEAAQKREAADKRAAADANEREARIQQEMVARRKAAEEAAAARQAEEAAAAARKAEEEEALSKMQERDTRVTQGALQHMDRSGRSRVVRSPEQMKQVDGFASEWARKDYEKKSAAAIQALGPRPVRTAH